MHILQYTCTQHAAATLSNAVSTKVRAKAARVVSMQAATARLPTEVQVMIELSWVLSKSAHSGEQDDVQLTRITLCPDEAPLCPGEAPQIDLRSEPEVKQAKLTHQPTQSRWLQWLP